MLKRLQSLGPGLLVSAAFIGPGTLTACTLAGTNFGYTLLWALFFTTIATIVLQEMTARLGIVSQQGLGEALMRQWYSSIIKWPLIGVLLTALYAGNAAYEAGNLAGAALGASAIFGESYITNNSCVILITLIAAIILCSGSYKLIEKVLVALVLFMCLTFVATFFVVQPNLLSMLNGLFVPSIPQDGILMTVALIGTTIVPYNLFLHASAVKKRWQHPKELKTARIDTALSIGLGGLVSILIVSTAAASMYANALEVNSAADMAHQLTPLFGASAQYLLGIGMLAAGLSSAITAPLATAYAVSELLSLSKKETSIAFRFISLSVLGTGCVLAVLGIKPIKLILLAQFANGLLLPIVAGFLLYVMNKKSLLGEYTNSPIANIAGIVVVLLTTVLGAKSILFALT